MKGSSLAAGGGIGRTGVVSHDFEASNETRRSPTKKGKHVS